MNIIYYNEIVIKSESTEVDKVTTQKITTLHCAWWFEMYLYHIIIMKYSADWYKREYTPTMTINEFIHANYDFLNDVINKWAIKSNAALDSYYRGIMVKLYVDYLNENN